MSEAKQVRCQACGGTGYYQGPRLGDEPCPRCGGLGTSGDVANIQDIASIEKKSAPITMKSFSKMNAKRCTSPTGFNCALDAWSLSDWMVAVLGELGEAANVLKKLNRVRDGIRGNKESEAELRQKFKRELADAFIYLDLVMQASGFDTEDAVLEVFHSKSREIGYVYKIEDQ